VFENLRVEVLRDFMDWVTVGESLKYAWRMQGIGKAWIVT